MSDLPEGARPRVELGASVAGDVAFGAFVVVHSGTIVGPGCLVGDHAVLGAEPSPDLDARAPAPGGQDPPARLGATVSVGAGASVGMGASIGDGAIVGDQAHVGTGASVGPGTVVGRASTVGAGAALGARVRVQSNVRLGAQTVVEDDVFVGPGARTGAAEAAAPTAAGDGSPSSGAILRRACRVGGGVVVLPGVEIGEEAFIAAGAEVIEDVPARAVVMGRPARVVGRVGDEDLLERWR